jgi:hypothetical protein
MPLHGSGFAGFFRVSTRRATHCASGIGIAVPNENHSATTLLKRTSALTLAVACLALVLTGCWRKATEADCSAIVDRDVELQMRKMAITDETAIAKKQQEIRSQFSESMKGCVGRRITDGMMKCVKDAQTVEAIDQCMR